MEGGQGKFVNYALVGKINFIFIATPFQNPLAQEENKKGSKRTAPEDSLALSFFAWFGDEEEDQELAEEIKENFWPNLVGYYHNVSRDYLHLDANTTKNQGR